MPGLTRFDFVPPTGPISMRSANRLGKMKATMVKYWTDPDKFIAFVMAGSGIILACFGSVLISLGIGLPVACYLSYKRSNSDLYTNSRVVLHDLLKFPKYSNQVLAMLKKADKEQLEKEEQSRKSNSEENEPNIISNSRALKYEVQPEANNNAKSKTNSENDIFYFNNDKIEFNTGFAGDNMFPLNIVLLAKPLNPNMKTPAQAIGYLCIDYIDRICSEDTQKEVEDALSSKKDLEPSQFQSEIERLGVHYDLLKRERKDLFAYTFGTACVLKKLVIKSEFRGNNLGIIMFAYALQKLRKMANIDILLCQKESYVENKLMEKFFGRFYTPPDFCRTNKNLHQALRSETIFFPIYKNKLDYACETALEKFFMFEKLKKNTVPYFAKDEDSSYCMDDRESSTVAIVGPTNQNNLSTNF